MRCNTDQVGYMEHISEVCFEIAPTSVRDLKSYIYVTLGVFGILKHNLIRNQPDIFLCFLTQIMYKLDQNLFKHTTWTPKK